MWGIMPWNDPQRRDVQHMAAGTPLLSIFHFFRSVGWIEEGFGGVPEVAVVLSYGAEFDYRTPEVSTEIVG